MILFNQGLPKTGWLLNYLPITMPDETGEYKDDDDDDIYDNNDDHIMIMMMMMIIFLIMMMMMMMMTNKIKNQIFNYDE